MGLSCSRRGRPQANDEDWIVIPAAVEDGAVFIHPVVHDPQGVRRRLARIRLRKVLFTVLKLKRLRWLQALVRASLNCMKVRNSPALRQKFASLLSSLTRMVSGTACWFSHVTRVQGTLYFSEHLSSAGNATRETKQAEKKYRVEKLGLTNAELPR